MGVLSKLKKAVTGIETLNTRYEPSTPYYTTMIAPMPTRLDYSEMPSGIASLGDQNTRNLMDMQRKSFSRFVPRQTSSLSNVGKPPSAPPPPVSVPAFPQIGLPSLGISPLPGLGLKIGELGSMAFPDLGNAGYF